MTKLVPSETSQKANTVEGGHPEDPEVGKWYWHTQTVTNTHYNEETKEHNEYDTVDRTMVCITHVGSNYILVEGPFHSKMRIHDSEFWARCEHIPNPDTLIDQQIEEKQAEVKRLMGQVKELTARLSIGNNPALPEASETQALALRTGNQPVDEYKAALVKAKKEILPDLFKQIKEANSALALWMKAKLIPLEAQAKGLESVKDAVENRIFSVELYAGLVEQVEQVRSGKPAELTEKIHLMQRRAYMDEECLARYTAGGMEFKDIQDFDKWLAKAENLDRILPFPRCIIAFRVRRTEKERTARDIFGFIRMMEDRELDKFTFLYIRNGEQLFRLRTGIEFGDKLFPDLNQQIMSRGKMWAKFFAGHLDKKAPMLTDEQYRALVAEEDAHEAEVNKLPEEEHYWRRNRRTSTEYQPFTKESVYYDDMATHVAGEMQKHNRLVLVLQGLLDRSPVLHPHPPWSLWSGDGFEQALQLIFDESLALTTGGKPDFEAYRKRLNASLTTGSVTVGQEIAWEEAEAIKEAERLSKAKPDYEFTRTRFRPHGDPGPGTLARVAKYSPRTGKCTYEWNKARRNATWKTGDNKVYIGRFSTEAGKVLNVDAYTPGDFKKFFEDPRTRAEYLEWAPYLLEAEEYHAGNRELAPTAMKPPPREPNPETRYLYQQRKQARALLGQTIRLKKQVKTKGGKIYEKGSLWRINSVRGVKFDAIRIDDQGETERDAEGSIQEVRRLASHYFEIDGTALPKKVL
jgi:hypothetical protein